MATIAHSQVMRQQKNRPTAIVRDITGQGFLLDLGKKVSTPKDLMMEELSLQNNRGSLMYQKRQQRVQRFILEHPESYTHAGKQLTTSQGAQGAGGAPGTNATNLVDGYSEDSRGKENYRTEVFIPPGGKGAAPAVPKKSIKFLQKAKTQNPGAIAPGYSGPLTEIPPEKFNITAIPKSYRSPWHEELDYYENSVPMNAQEDLPELPQNSLDLEYRSFNRAAMPFGGSVSERTYVLPLFEEPAQPPQPEAPGILELMCKRRSFNRAPRGWRMQNVANSNVPESDDL